MHISWNISTKLPCEKLKTKFLTIVDFGFKGEGKTFIRLHNNGAAF